MLIILFKSPVFWRNKANLVHINIISALEAGVLDFYASELGIHPTYELFITDITLKAPYQIKRKSNGKPTQDMIMERTLESEYV